MYSRENESLCDKEVHLWDIVEVFFPHPQASIFRSKCLNGVNLAHQ